MKAFLTIWRLGTSVNENKIVDCKTLTINDAELISIEGESSQLFDVFADGDKFSHVATVEVM